ncbi:LmeA family phospholipid-binding protein [Corynebacterium hindlerae]|uniref:LmeA family phospholipid-binding protein n=1 Tax=Corynebacterium hindlerae TaxID=699041 RepID=UPI0031B703D6
MQKSPRLRITALLLGLVLILSWLVDSVVAARAERTLAADVQHYSRLSVAPRIHLGGFPYLANLWRKTTPSLSAEMLDVDVPGFGMMNARTEVTDLTLDRTEILTGQLSEAPAKLVTRNLRLDGVAMGAQLDITDLDISNPYDISPSGGPASEVQLTGTPQGFDKPVTVVAKLRINGTSITMTPDRYIDVPEDREREAKDAFTWTIDSRSLPLPAPVNRVYCAGGSIYFEAEQRTTTVDASNLSPISKLEAEKD